MHQCIWVLIPASRHETLLKTNSVRKQVSMPALQCIASCPLGTGTNALCHVCHLLCLQTKHKIRIVNKQGQPVDEEGEAGSGSSGAAGSSRQAQGVLVQKQ